MNDWSHDPRAQCSTWSHSLDLDYKRGEMQELAESWPKQRRSWPWIHAMAIMDSPCPWMDMGSRHNRSVLGQTEDIRCLEKCVVVVVVILSSQLRLQRGCSYAGNWALNWALLRLPHRNSQKIHKVLKEFWKVDQYPILYDNNFAACFAGPPCRPIYMPCTIHETEY